MLARERQADVRVSVRPPACTRKGSHRRALGALLNCGINTAGSEKNLEKSPKERKGLVEPQDWMVTRRNEFLCPSVKMWGSETQEGKAEGWQHLCVWA